MEITTPALLFPAISLLLLAYTNRFLALAALIRNLHSREREHHEPVLRAQIDRLRKRLALIRSMQTFGILSLLFCVVCMFVVFTGYAVVARAIFVVSLLLMMASLLQSARETHHSTDALDLQLEDLGK